MNWFKTQLIFTQKKVRVHTAPNKNLSLYEYYDEVKMIIVSYCKGILGCAAPILLIALLELLNLSLLVLMIPSYLPLLLLFVILKLRARFFL